MNSFQEIKTNLSEILSESTAYGISKVFKSKRIFIKLFWLSFIILGSISTIYFIVDSVQNYLKYEIIPQFEIRHENQITFPTLTFCSNAFHNNKTSFKDIINYCFFEREENNCINYFQMFYSAVLKANCLQFNSGKNFTNHSIPILSSTTAANYKYGLFISFKTNSKQQKIYINIYIDDPASISFINGESYKYADYTLQYEPYFMYDIYLSKSVEYKLGQPYSQCLKDPLYDFQLDKTIINYIHSKQVSYKQAYCHQLCRKLEYIQTKQCNCSTNTSLGNVWLDCSYLQTNKIIQECTDFYIKNYDWKQIDVKCKQYCPLECDTITYTYSSRNNNFENESSPISIYYKDFKYSFYSEIPKTEVFSFISEIGGILGLFIGCSFVSLFELTEMVLEIGFILCGQRAETSQNSYGELSLEEEVNRLKNENKEIKDNIQLLFKSVKSKSNESLQMETLV